VRRKRRSETATRRKHPVKSKEPASLQKQLIAAIPLILGVNIVSFLLVAFGLIQPVEILVADTWQKIIGRHESKNVVIVAISSSDYQQLFSSMSPLDSLELHKIIDAIAKGNPKVIGVDIDTSQARFKGLASKPEWPPVIWARTSIPIGNGRFKAQPILGGTESALSAIVLMLSKDNEVRTYLRQVVTDRGVLDSFPVAVANAYRSPTVAASSVPSETQQSARLLEFWGASNKRYRFATYDAAVVLKGAKGSEWQTNGVLAGKIVLLGGTYDRDWYHTPIGVMSGVELLGEAVETELNGGGVPPPSELLLFCVNILVGVVIILIYQELGFGLGAMINLVAIFLVPPVLSITFFSTARYWGIFMPMPIAFLIQHSYAYGRSHQHEAFLKLYHRLRHQ
jgi:CHASE2 domain-containing sensor protein